MRSKLDLSGKLNLKKLNRKYFAEMRYPIYLDKLQVQDNCIFLESQQGNGIDGNIYYIVRELLTNEEYRSYRLFISAKTRSVECKVQKLIDSCGASAYRAQVVKTFSFRYYYLMASCKYLINDNTFASFFIKRAGQVYINTWHGTPLKNLGRHNNSNANMLGNVQKNFFFTDYMMCPNRYTYDCMVSDYMLEDLCKARVLINGYPRNTILKDKEKRRAIRSKYCIDGYRVYAYMPTWRTVSVITRQEEKDLITPEFRDYVKAEKKELKKRTTFSEATNYWLKKIDSLLSDDEILFVKTHLLEEERFKHLKYDHIRPYPADEETYEFLTATDCLITDYSSVMFDYAVTGNKVVLFPYDHEEYASSVGLHRELSELPFPVAYDAGMLVHELRTAADYDNDAVVREFCMYDDADATSRLLKRTILDQDSGIPEFSVRDNGRKNVLMFVGDLSQNGVTSSLRGLLANIDTEKNNYYLNFQGTAVSPNKAFLFELPENVRYISRIGKMPITLKQNIVMRLYNHRIISLDRFWPTMKSAYEKDILRQFGYNKFDVAVQFTGYEYKKQMLYSLFDAKRLIYVHSNMISEKNTRNNQRLDALNYAYNNYDGIIAVSDAMVQPTQEIAGRDVDVNVVFNMIDVERIRKCAEEDIVFGRYTQSTVRTDKLENILDGSGKTFISVGRFSPEKGHERLVSAFDRYWKTHRDDHLIILGGSQMFGGYNKLRRFIGNLESAGNIILIKRLDNPYSLIGRCDGMLLSSFYEGFGLVLIEGDILGLPVVSVDIDGPRSFLRENGGTLVDNSEDGLFEGFNLISEGKVPVMHADYDKINRTNAERFENLI